MIPTAGAASFVRPVPTFLWKHPAFLLAAGLFTVRVLYLPWCELFPEEAYYWNYARHLDIGYLDHPPMVAWLIWLGTAVFGHGEWGVRSGALLCSLATSFFAFRLTETLFRDRRAAAAAAVGLVQCLPYFFMSGWIMTPDAPLTAGWAAMLYFLARVFFDGEGRAWLGVGLSLGLGMLSKYTLALLGPATLLFMLLDPVARGWFRRIAPYAGVTLAAVLFSPVVVWNARHHWASFAYQSVGRIKLPSHFSTPALLGTILVVLTPPGLALAGWALWRRAPLDEGRRRVLFARVYVLVPLAVFVFFSFTHHVKLNWTGPLWLAAVPAMASLLVSTPAGWFRRSWVGVVAVLCAGYFVLLQYLATGLPGVRYFQPTELLPVGWKPLALELTTQQQTLRRDDASQPVFIVGMDRDFIASEVAFYSPDPARAVRETTGAHLFDGDSLMYAFWFPPASEDGATLLLVAFEKRELDTPRIARHSVAQGPIDEHLLQVDGKPVRPYYTRVVSGYHSERSAP